MDPRSQKCCQMIMRRLVPERAVPEWEPKKANQTCNTHTYMPFSPFLFPLIAGKFRSVFVVHILLYSESWSL